MMIININVIHCNETCGREYKSSVSNQIMHSCIHIYFCVPHYKETRFVDLQERKALIRKKPPMPIPFLHLKSPLPFPISQPPSLNTLTLIYEQIRYNNFLICTHQVQYFCNITHPLLLIPRVTKSKGNHLFVSSAPEMSPPCPVKVSAPGPRGLVLIQSCV